jgi:hypothetical protein
MQQQQHTHERELERLKNDMSQQAELVLPRLEAYRKSWAITHDASPTLVKDKGMGLTSAKRDKMEEELRAWYFENGGNGIFLSSEARDLFVQGVRQLIGTASGDAVETLSQLRTQTKNELGIYGKWSLEDMDETEKIKLLKDEYLHLQKAIDDFDTRVLTIKAWSITFSLVVFTAAFSYRAPAALLVGSLSACLFWIIEGMWKEFQLAYYDRAQKIEDYFAGETQDIVPMQIKTSWYKSWKNVNPKQRRKRMLWPHVALPHVVVFLLGLLLYALHRWTGIVPV